MIEQIRKYIDSTPAAKLSAKSRQAYGMGAQEILEVASFAMESPFDAVLLAFEYGKAKGLREGRREAAKNTK